MHCTPYTLHATRYTRIDCVYVMRNAANSVLYVGVTNNLRRRVREHPAASTDIGGKRCLPIRREKIR